MSQPIEEFSRLIEERTGLAIGVQFGSGLPALLATLSQGDPAGYLRKMHTAPDTDPAWQAVIKALTIGETYFLRDDAHFQLMRTRILPEIIARRRQHGQRELAIWSAGCASGEEAYSLAITLAETLADLDDWQITLLGTDLNSAALSAARRGVYRQWAFRNTTHDFQTRYFDQSTDGLQIQPRFRDLVTFRQANVLSWTPLIRFDLVLCRHVLLYFHQAQACRAEDRLYEALLPGGWLLLGQSEDLHHRRERWQSHAETGAPLFQRPRPALTPASPPPRRSDPLHNGLTFETSAQSSSALVEKATYEMAVRAIQNEDYGQAELLLTELIAARPDSAPAHTLMACVQVSARNIAQAKQILQTALRLDPLLADAHYLQALLHLEDGQRDAAVRALRAALYSQRNHPLASYLLGTLRAQEGSLPEARRHWINARRAIARLMPESLVSDIADMTAGRLQSLLAAHLDDQPPTS